MLRKIIGVSCDFWTVLAEGPVVISFVSWPSSTQCLSRLGKTNPVALAPLQVTLGPCRKGCVCPAPAICRLHHARFSFASSSQKEN